MCIIIKWFHGISWGRLHLITLRKTSKRNLTSACTSPKQPLEASSHIGNRQPDERSCLRYCFGHPWHLTQRDNFQTHRRKFVWKTWNNQGPSTNGASTTSKMGNFYARNHLQHHRQVLAAAASRQSKKDANESWMWRISRTRNIINCAYIHMYV